MNLEGTKDNVIDDVTTSIEEKLIDLSSNMKKQKVDFVWKQKNGLRYVSDKSLELVYELLKMQKDNLWIECVDDKIIFHNQFINFCNINKTSQELLLEVQNTSNNVVVQKESTFPRNKDNDINNICFDCKYQICPKNLLAYVIYLINKNELKEKLDDRKKFRTNNNSLNDVFAFEWNYGDILRVIPDEMYEFCEDIVKKGWVYVDRTLNNQGYIRTYTPFSCMEAKLMFIHLDNNQKFDKDKSTWGALSRKPNDAIGFCNVYECRLNGCPIAISGILYYLKAIGKEEIIEADRQYYKKHKEKMDQIMKDRVNKQNSKIQDNINKSLEDLEEYKNQIDKFDDFVSAISNDNQKNLHCILEGECDSENEKIINAVNNFLIYKSKIQSNNLEKFTLQNLAASNTYNYIDKSNTKFKDKNGVLYQVENAIKYTVLEEKKLYIITGIKEFLDDYKKIQNNNYKNIDIKQYKHAIDLLVDTNSCNYIIINGTKEEIDGLLKLDPRLKYIYQNYRFKFREISLEETFKYYLKNLDNDIFDKIKNQEYEYKKKFMEYVSLNKNFIPFKNKELASYLALYSNSKGEAVLPENIYKKESVDEALNDIIGLDNVKTKLKEFEKYMLFKVRAESEGLKLESSNMHMLFTGNPGTGKTTIARIMAKMLFDMGIIKENKLIEVSRKDLIAGYIGQTAIKTSEIIEKAMGGVLFIDEAYSLANGTNNDFGKEAISTLIKAMEDYKDQLVVIFAGYKNEMLKFIDMNPGISSRIGYSFDFQDYTVNELVEIFYKKMNKMGFKCRKECDSELRKVCNYFLHRKSFGNGRFVDKLIQETILNHSINNNVVDIIEVNDIPSIKEFNNTSEEEETTEELLKNIVGLENLKKKIVEFENYVKFLNKISKQNVKIPNQNMHMIFTGNPGTGKTTIARIMAKILFNTGIIYENKLVEVSRKDLIAGYVGQTAIKTSEIIEKALGGVLFIDEAYSLVNGYNNDFGSEAISTLIKAMEDYKNQLVVIFAGYKEKMREFVEANPGISSRIGYVFHFPDYTREELAKILYKKIDNSNLKIEGECNDKIAELMNYFCNVENIGNGRFVDKIFQEILIKHAQNADEDIEIIKIADIPTIKEVTTSLFNGSNMIDPEKLTDKSLEKTAIHEIGHALVRYKLYKDPGIVKITINPEGMGTLGYVRHKLDEGDLVQTKTTLLNEIKVCLAGMASEEIFYSEFSNGNTSDLQTATNIAKNMVTRYGMSSFGLGQIKNPDDKLSIKVEDEINNILGECYNKTKEIVKNNMELIKKLVKFLLNEKEISEEEFLNIINKEIKEN